MNDFAWDILLVAFLFIPAMITGIACFIALCIVCIGLWYCIFPSDSNDKGAKK